MQFPGFDRYRFLYIGIACFVVALTLVLYGSPALKPYSALMDYLVYPLLWIGGVVFCIIGISRLKKGSE